MKIMRFEDLEAWRHSRNLVTAVYRLTRKPGLDRDYGLSGQLQRASVSVMSNIAEGFERRHPAEKVQAYNVSRASCGEVRSLSYVVFDCYPEYGSESEDLRSQVEEVGLCLSGLIASTAERSKP
jgi:four helix bundle protein